MEPRARAAPPRTVVLLDLPVELIARVLSHLSSTRDLGRAGCVCRAWHMGDSPVERVLRLRIEARGGAVAAALPRTTAASLTARLCRLESISTAQAASGVMGSSVHPSAAVDAHGRLCVWGELKNHAVQNAEPIFSCRAPTVVQTPRIERICLGAGHILALTDTGAVLSFGLGKCGQLGHGDRADRREPMVIEALRDVRVGHAQVFWSACA